jgi:DNA-binding Lrp family transcriptional regulator
MFKLDDLDRGLIHALHLDGRVPFSRVAEALDSSEQTVARRYQRLRAQAGLRVVGLPVPERAGRGQWMVRLATAPAATRGLADALARRPDTSWVKLISGGTEVTAILTTPYQDEPVPSLLLHDIPRKAGITAVSAYCFLHTYLGGPTTWPGRLTGLDERQRELLRPPAREPAPARPLTDADRAVLDALRADGRASYQELAAATGFSQATVARRLADLRDMGAVFFDVDVAPALYGVAMQALLWLSVAPSRLDQVASAMAGHAELAAVMSTTGPVNLVAQALCESPADLHRYLTRRLGAVDGIHTLETTPVLQTVKTGASTTARYDRLPAHPSSVDHQRVPMHVARGGRAQEQHGTGDVVRLGPAAGRDASAELGVADRILAKRLGVIGLDIAGRHRVDVHPLGRPLVAHRLGEPDDGVLAGRVRGHVDAALEGEHRGDVDDLAVAALDHAPGERPGQLEDRVEVHGEDRAPVVRVGVEQRRAADRPRVVDQDVDRRPASSGEVAGRAADLFEVGHVEQDDVRLGAHLAGHLAQCPLIAAGQHGGGAGLSEGQRDRASDALVCPGDQRRLPGQAELVV